MTTIDLVVAGRAGHASRTDPATRTARASLVDDWELTPRTGDPVQLLVTDVYVPKGVYAVTLASRNALAPFVRDAGLSERLGMDVHLVERMCVDSRTQARTVAAHLARHVTTGVLPFRPAAGEERVAWQALIRVLAMVARQPENTPGFRRGVSLAGAPA